METYVRAFSTTLERIGSNPWDEVPTIVYPGEDYVTLSWGWAPFHRCDWGRITHIAGVRVQSDEDVIRAYSEKGK